MHLYKGYLYLLQSKLWFIYLHTVASQTKQEQLFIECIGAKVSCISFLSQFNKLYKL